ncbi:MAG TPA: peptidoglycan bridge formation glycyltransferase FemA/FemB family protein [Ktedonobacteraceae bacterium]|nr:peptidoglycan bridge formation glycyltransferase FemA/FemB family protein [Ktedonobacteraceae bacterium]
MVEQYLFEEISAERRAEWDAFVGKQESGHFLQSWSWGELKEGANWKPLRFALYERSEGKIVAAAQVLRRTVASIPARLGHLAYVPRGPVLDWTATTSDGNSLALFFLSKLREYVGRRGALALQVEPHLESGTVEAQTLLASLKGLAFKETQAVQPLRTIALGIQPEEDKLLAQMKEKWRYNVRLAARKGVKVQVAQAQSELDAWYALLQTTGQRDQFGIHTLDYYRRFWKIFQSRQQARLFLAYAEQELLAGIFVGLFGREAIYLYGASSNERRNLMPNYLLQWEAIRWARQAGAHSYDFWGIPATDADDEDMAGVYRFKRGWGGRVVRFIGNYEYVYHPLTVSIARKFLR